MYTYLIAAEKVVKVIKVANKVKLLKAAKIAKAVGPVLIASQRVADDVKRKKKRIV